MVRFGGNGWVVMTVANSIDSPSLWPLYHDYFFTPEKGKRHKDGLTAGTEKHKIFSELDVRPEDKMAIRLASVHLLKAPVTCTQGLNYQGLKTSL